MEIQYKEGAARRRLKVVKLSSYSHKTMAFNNVQTDKKTNVICVYCVYVHMCGHVYVCMHTHTRICPAFVYLKGPEG